MEGNTPQIHTPGLIHPGVNLRGLGFPPAQADPGDTRSRRKQVLSHCAIYLPKPERSGPARFRTRSKGLASCPSEIWPSKCPTETDRRT